VSCHSLLKDQYREEWAEVGATNPFQIQIQKTTVDHYYKEITYPHEEKKQEPDVKVGTGRADRF
jgi:hypothetical protein